MSYFHVTYRLWDPTWRRLLMWLGMEIICLGERAFIERSKEITWRDHARWKVEDIGNWFFSVGYDGSGAELASALNGELPIEYFNERQWEAVRREFGDDIPLTDDGKYIATYREMEEEL